jgi:uncharacterized protein YbjT (DUF2867 family)
MKSDLILVTGATGTTGAEVVRQLLVAEQNVRVLVRDPQKVSDWAGKVEIIQADLATPETLKAAFDGVAKVYIVANGPQLPEYEKNAFTAAKAAGVKHIVKLSGRHLDAPFMAESAHARWHNDAEDALRSLGVPWTILRPGWFASNLLIFGVKEQRAIVFPTGNGKDIHIDPRDIAAVAVKALTTPDHEGKVYELTGTEFLSFTDVAAKLSQALGYEIPFINIAPEAFREAMVSNGAPADHLDSVLSYFKGVREGKIYPLTQTVQEILGRPARTFDDWLADHVELLRS